MDLTIINQLIGSVGFPIACCIILFWQLNKNQNNHREEMDKMAEALSNNTLVMQKLLAKLEGR